MGFDLDFDDPEDAILVVAAIGALPPIAFFCACSVLLALTDGRTGHRRA